MFSDVSFESSYQSWQRNAQKDRLLGGCSKCGIASPGNTTWPYMFGKLQMNVLDAKDPKVLNFP
jgi:hypothetical protein